MKKKLALTLITLVCAFCLAFGFVGCDFGKGMLNKSKLTLKIGESYQLTAKSESEVAWKSDDETVVRVNNAGKVTAMEEGSATIIASAQDGESATCAVTVKGLVESGVAGMTFVFDDILCSGEYPDFEQDKASMEKTDIVFDNEGKGASYSMIPGTYIVRGGSVVFTPEIEMTGSMVFRIVKNRLVLTMENETVTLSIIYKVKIDIPEDEPDPEKPGPNEPGSEIAGKTFIFEDVTSEDGYPYLDTMKGGMKGQEIIFNTDGTLICKAGAYTFNGTYTAQGNTVTVTMKGQTGSYTIEDDKIVTSSQLTIQGTTYTITTIFRLKTEDDEPYFEELAGKTFKFENATSTTLDASTLNSVKNSYKNATITFSADGTYTLYNPGDNIESDPNAYSRQTGTFTCRNGEGYLTITSMVSGGEVIDEIPSGSTMGAIAFDGSVLKIGSAEMQFTYVLVTE